MTMKVSGPGFGAGRWASGGADGEERLCKLMRHWTSDLATDIARLRVVRQGARFSLYAAEEDAEYRLLDAFDISRATVEFVRFAAEPGWVRPIGHLDVRLLDFAMTAQELVGYRAGVNNVHSKCNPKPAHLLRSTEQRS